MPVLRETHETFLDNCKLFTDAINKSQEVNKGADDKGITEFLLTVINDKQLDCQYF